MSRQLTFLIALLWLASGVRALAQVGPRTPGQTPAAPNPAHIANQAIKDAQAKLATQGSLKANRTRAADRSLQKLSENAVGPATDFSYLTMKPDELRKRLGMRGQVLTAKEAALLQALDTALPVNLDRVPLTTLLESLRAKTKQNFSVDSVSLGEANIDYERPITLKLKKATVRELLKKVLVARGMDYIVASDGIIVVTREQAAAKMTVRQYPVSDMLGCRTRPRWAVLRTAEVLIQAIKNSINPGQWDTNGASITYHEATEALVVRAPAEVHLRMRAQSK